MSREWTLQGEEDATYPKKSRGQSKRGKKADHSHEYTPCFIRTTDGTNAYYRKTRCCRLCGRIDHSHTDWFVKVDGLYRFSEPADYPELPALEIENLNNKFAAGYEKL